MLEARNLNILNKANNLVFANPISFIVQSSEIWRFRGPNGIGKSSVYESFIGLRQIYQGEIVWESKITLNELSPSKRIALGIKYTPQKNAFFSDLTILENLKIVTDYLTPSDQNKEEILNHAITTFKLTEFINKLPTQLSGGQVRLSELSKLMIGPAKLALVDEPFAALDINTIEKVCEIFLHLKECGTSFFLNDHNLKAVESIADFDLALTKNTVKIIPINKKKEEVIP